MKSAALLEAIKKAGSVTKLAELLDVRPQAISQWQRAPVSRVLDIEGATGVSRYKLRPDIYPPARRAKRPVVRADDDSNTPESSTRAAA